MKRITKTSLLGMAFAFGTGAASAATFNVEDISATSLAAATAGVVQSTTETFENRVTSDQQIDTTGGYALKVGSVTVLRDGTGSPGPGGGGSVIGDGTDLALRDGNNYGRVNTTPNGAWFLDSNDTFGMVFDISAAFDFNRIFFSLTDAADQKARVRVEESSGGTFFDQIVNFNNGTKKLVTIDFDQFILFPGSLKITIANLDSSGNLKINDGYGIDDFTVARVGDSNEPEPVPLPAGGVLLLTALGGLGLARRRKARKAA